MHKTRQKILDYLDRHRQANALDLSRALGLTPANIRHHLKELVERGLIQRVGTGKTGGRGRPAHIYRVTYHNAPEALMRLVELLWTELISNVPARQHNARLLQLAASLTANTPASQGSLPQRLVQTIQKLQSLGFQAHWEAHAEAPIIVLDRCPFSDLQPRCPEICRLDALVLSQILGASVEQLSVRQWGERGPTGCTFSVLP